MNIHVTKAVKELIFLRTCRIIQKSGAKLLFFIYFL